MDFDFLSPVSDTLLDEITHLNAQTIGAQLKLHTSEHGLPDLDKVNVAIFGVRENRRAVREDSIPDFESLRSQLYSLYLETGG